MALSEIQRSEVVAAAAEVFWRAGFEDAKIEDVVRATGVNRYSLYSAFGGKRELFLDVLAAYHARGREIFFEGLNDESLAPLDAIRRVCVWAIHEMAARRAGCLIHNVAVDQAQNDPLVAGRVREYTSEIEKAFAVALARAAERGELNPVVAPAAGARHLLVLKYGLGDFAKSGGSEEDMIEILDSGLAMLGRGTGTKARAPGGRAARAH
jgi:TetR/AcrR family transcriptional repressor of nem operon